MTHATVRDFLAGVAGSPTPAERIAAEVEELDPEVFRQLRDALVEHVGAGALSGRVPPEETLALALTRLHAMEQVIAYLRFCLSREFAPPTWDLEDANAADDQGWNIFENHGEGHAWQLQRDDSAALFADDDAAWTFVRVRAATGDFVAARALLFLRYACPEEYAAILEATCHLLPPDPVGRAARP
ncbi:MAG TPA: hypothetical protein VF263_24225 [Longimicrobiaceae bacterium]